MPRKRRAFIDKSKSTTYTVVCREVDESDGDEADEAVGKGTDAAAELVGRVGTVKAAVGDDEELELGGLLNVDDDGDDEEAFYKAWRKRREEDAAKGASHGGQQENTLPHERRMEILALGFPDDGYDYLQHLKAIGGADGDSNAGGNVFIASSRPRVREVEHDERAYDGSQIHEILRAGGADDAGESATGADVAAGSDIGATASKVQALRSVPRNREVLEVMEEMDRVTTVEEVEPGVFGCGDLNDDFVLFASQRADDDQEAEETPSRRRAPRPRGSGDAGTKTSGAAYMKEVDVKLRLVDECFDALALREYNGDDDDLSDLDDDGFSEDSDDEVAGGRSSNTMDIADFDDVLDEYLAEKRGARYLTENDVAPVSAPECNGGSAGAAAAVGTSVQQLACGSREAEEHNRDYLYEHGVVVKGRYREERRPVCDGVKPEGERKVAAAMDEEDEDEEDADDEVAPLSNSRGGNACDRKFRYLGRDSEWVDVSDYKSLNEDIESCASFRTVASTPSIIPMVRSLGVPKKSKGAASGGAEGEAAKRIVLSKKTGMPIGFFPTAHAAAGTGDGAADNEDDGPCDDDVPRASTYRPRGKQETSEERRARKQAVKLERRHNRARKKDLRNQFKSSEMKLRDLKDNPPTIPL